MKDFLKYLLANFVALGIVLGGCVMLFFLFLSMSLMSSQPEIHVQDKSVLVLDMSTPIIDRPTGEEISLLAPLTGGSQERLSLHNVLQGLERAAHDERIVALYLTGNVMATDWANLEEIRDGLTRFKESGKPIVAYSQYYREGDYFLASLADHIMLSTDGVLEFNGTAAQVMFWKSAFDKYGIGVQVTRVGKFKAAVEPYTEDRMTDANRTQIELLLNDIFDVVIDRVAQSRSVTPERLRELTEAPGLLAPEQAQIEGLVDQVVHYDEVLAYLRKYTREKERAGFQKQIGLGDYLRTPGSNRTVRGKDRIAVIYIEGEIVDGSSRDQAGGDDVARLLRRARLDDQVKAVVMRVNTPGGSAPASEVMLREARLLQETKPVVVSMGGEATSGGYWISAYADEIHARETTTTGSIGVFGMYTNFRELMNRHGLNVDVAKTSPMADSMTAFRPKTDAELAVLQTMVDKIYDRFLDIVSEGRELPREKVHEMAQGRVWSGKQALQLGLIDTIGGLEGAVEAAAKRAKTDDYQWFHYQKPRTFAEELARIMEHRRGYIQAQGPLHSAFTQIEQGIERLLHFDKPFGVYALQPYQLSID